MAGATKSTMMIARGQKGLSPPTRHLTSQTVSGRQSSYAPSQVAPANYALSNPATPSILSTMPKSHPLSILPLASVLRSLAITSISSSPILLRPSLAIMSALAHSQSPLLSPDTNPILRYFLKKTFYKQFCAGENPGEINRTIDGLRSLGFKGVILNYAREISLDDKIENKIAAAKISKSEEVYKQDEVIPWARGTMETVKLVTADDFVAVKFTGAGRQALNALRHQQAPPPALKEAIDSICELAASRGVRLLFDAENAALQPGIDAWTLEYMRKYNKLEQGKAIVFGTYQAYLKGAPAVLASHMATARKEGFTLGVKLVRGAYLGSDPRHLIHDTKEDTDNSYDSISESLARRSYGTVLKPAAGESVEEFPQINVVLAQHNQTSVRKIQAIRNSQIERGEEQIDLVHAQLQGMADEVSCELVHAGTAGEGEKKVDIPQAYKYLVWGTTGECMKYLLRRAQENKDAVQRTREGRDAMAGELVRRVKKAIGMAR